MLWMLTLTNIMDYSCSILTDKSSRRKTKTTNEINDMKKLDNIQPVIKIKNDQDMTESQKRFHSFRFGNEKDSMKKGTIYLGKIADELSSYLNKNPESSKLYEVNFNKFSA